MGIAKFVGDKVIEDDCTHMVANVILHVYVPPMDPFADEPLAVVPITVLHGYRMRVGL